MIIPDIGNNKKRICAICRCLCLKKIIIHVKNIAGIWKKINILVEIFFPTIVLIPAKKLIIFFFVFYYHCIYKAFSTFPMSLPSFYQDKKANI